MEHNKWLIKQLKNWEKKNLKSGKNFRNDKTIVILIIDGVHQMLFNSNVQGYIREFNRCKEVHIPVAGKI